MNSEADHLNCMCGKLQERCIGFHMKFKSGCQQSFKLEMFTNTDYEVKPCVELIS